MANPAKLPLFSASIVSLETNSSRGTAELHGGEIHGVAKYGAYIHSSGLHSANLHNASLHNAEAAITPGATITAVSDREDLGSYLRATLDIAYLNGLGPEMEELFQAREAEQPNPDVEAKVQQIYRPAATVLLKMFSALDRLRTGTMPVLSNAQLLDLYLKQDATLDQRTEHQVVVNQLNDGDTLRRKAATLSFAFGSELPDMVLKSGFQINTSETGLWLAANATGVHHRVNACLALEARFGQLEAGHINENRAAVCYALTGALLAAKPFGM